MSPDSPRDLFDAKAKWHAAQRKLSPKEKVAIVLQLQVALMYALSKVDPSTFDKAADAARGLKKKPIEAPTADSPQPATA